MAISPVPPPVGLVRRLSNSTKDSSPCAVLAFTLPERSDDLYDALKTAYPAITEHDQRKLQAQIDFLAGELRAMQEEEKKRGAIPINESRNSSSPARSMDYNGEVLSRNGSRSTSASSYSSFAGDRVQDTRPADTFQSDSSRKLAVSSLPQVGHTIVFNRYNGQSVQTKTRKKMNPEERAQYKETRKRGACAHCRKSKGKCTHPQDPTYQSSETMSPKQTPSKRKRGPLDQGRQGSVKTLKAEEETISFPKVSMTNVNSPRVAMSPSGPSQGPQAENIAYIGDKQSGQKQEPEILSPPASSPSPPGCCESSVVASPATLPTPASMVSINTSHS